MPGSEPVGMPSAGPSSVVMIIAEQHVIETGNRVLDQHGGREVAVTRCEAMEWSLVPM